eukprot:9469658-Pyramimonas_sp.AAC.1
MRREWEQPVDRGATHARPFYGHRREAHNMGPAVAAAIVNNRCPRCKSALVDRRTTIDRAARSVHERGTRRQDRSKWAHPMQLPRTLTCQICTRQVQTFEEYLTHVRGHLAGPDQIRAAKGGAARGVSGRARDAGVAR